MIRIGMIGVENSHAAGFLRLMDKEAPKRVRGAKAVAVWGEPGFEKQTKEHAEEFGIPEIVAKPADMIGKIDAAICTCRDGAVHAKYSLPVIRAGIPTFVDKPFATTVADAKRMIAAAKKAKTAITTSSSIPYGSGAMKFLTDLKKLKKADIVSGISTGPADLASEYSGLFFYSFHATEMMRWAFGSDVKTVAASKSSANNVCAVVTFKGGRHCCLNLQHNSRAWDLSVYTKDGQALRADFTSSDGSRNLLLTILKMAKTGKPPILYDDMVMPVKVINAVCKSLETGKTVTIR